MIENPQPHWLPLLLLTFPGVALAAYAVNERLFPPDNRPLCTIPAIGMVLALLPTHVLALAFGSLTIGLTMAWSVIGLAGYVWIARQKNVYSGLAAKHPDWRRKLGITALATLPIILPTMLLNFHDETDFNGHFAIIAHLQNGTYPPRYLYEPTLPLRYHYAFDLAGAMVTGLLRVRVDHAIDLLTLALWPCMFLLLWRVGDHLSDKRAGLFVALSVCFAGGWPEFAWARSACGFCTVDGLRINPPFIHYFFQHPWSIGVPIFCLAVLQRAALPHLVNRTLGLVALVCSLALLSLSHAVLFITSVVALGLTEAWIVLRFRDRFAAIVLFGIGLSLVIARLIGGFFVAGAFPPAGGIFDTGFYLRTFAGRGAVLGQVQWDLASFGALLVLGVVGLQRARYDRLFLTILAILGLLIVNSLRYRYTWDIVKFGTVSFIVLAIGTGVALSDLLDRVKHFKTRLGLVILIICFCGQGVAYPFLVLWNYDSALRPRLSIQMIRPYFSLAYPVDSDDARAVSYLRENMGPSEIVYRAEEKSEPYAIWGGLPTQASVYPYPADDTHNDVYGLGESKLMARKNLNNISETWFDRLVAAHVNWVVTDREDIAINAIFECIEGKGKTVLAAQYGRVRVFRLE
jgi:lysylphosphatidylglycerol synthetase-like protein (DUF2156 family)